MPRTVKDRTQIAEGHARVKYVGTKGRQLTATVEGRRRLLKPGETYDFPAGEARQMCQSPFFEMLEDPSAAAEFAEAPEAPPARKLKED